MKLIIEQNLEQIKCLTEEDAKTKEKAYYIVGIFMQANKQNKNGRLYPLPIINREIRKYNDQYVKQNRAMGELGHPESPAVQLERVSHLIKDLKLEGNDVFGKAKLLDTPYGKIAKNLIDEGIKLGISSRGLGSLKETDGGIKEVQEDFSLQAIDIVADPSAPEAFAEGVMEGKEWVWESGIWKSKTIEEYKKQIQRVKRREQEEKFLKIFENLLTDPKLKV